MVGKEPQEVFLDFPGDIDFIPEVRKFISNVIHVNKFSKRFSFRTEIIIDELCSNAVKFGHLEAGENIRLSCRVTQQAVVLNVINKRAQEKHLKRLSEAISKKTEAQPFHEMESGRGIKIVKILADKVELVQEDGTCVRVTRKRNSDTVTQMSG